MEEEKKKEENVSNEDYLELKRSNEKKKAFIVVLIFAMILVVFLAVLFYLKLKNGEPKENGNTPTPTIAPTEEPTYEDDQKEYQKIVGASWHGEYTTTDKKHIIKIKEDGTITIDDKELIDISYEYDLRKDDKYLSFSADFNPPQAGLTALSFVLNKETKLIEERPGASDDWKSANSECGNWYGEYARFYDRCQGFGYVNVNNHYFFVKYQDFFDDIYTTDWKELGSVSSANDIKKDNEGIYVCADFELDDMTFKCTKETKYSYDGNKIS